MATSTKCIFEKKEISINQALDIKKKNKFTKFFCSECGNEVKPHASGGHTKAHFEHTKRNQNCSLSHDSEHYKYTSDKQKTKDPSLDEIYNSISENSKNLIEGKNINLRQLSSAKNFVCTPNCDKWTFGKSIWSNGKQFTDGGVAKNFLYKSGFTNILVNDNEDLKHNVISKFKTWASKLPRFDLISKFETDQKNLGRIELLVHISAIKEFKESISVENNEVETLGREEYYQRKQRTNQGLFRKKMIDYWKECCVTGIKDTSFLIASHIKPWKDCEPEEKLSVNNGLLLAAPIDFLFDTYSISFEDNGDAIISNNAENVIKHFTSLKEIKISRLLNKKQKEFLNYHRDLFKKKHAS